MENVIKPDFDISSSIDTATNPDVKKSNESKLVSYEIRFPDFYFSSVSPLLRGFVKYVVYFLMEMQVIGILLRNQGN